MTTTEDQATRSKTSELAPRLRLNLDRNLKALRKHRPDVFQTITSKAQCVGENGRYAIEPVAGRPALFRRGSDDSWACMSLTYGGRLVADPVAPYRQALSANTGKVLCGIGDGAILEWLARHPPQDPAALAGGAGTVYLLEGDEELVLHCLMLRDLTGPISQDRFHWFIGPSWREQAEQALLGEPMLADGGCVIGQGCDTAEMTEFWKQLAVKRAEAFAADCRAAAEHAASLDKRDLAAVFSDNPPRRPRVLLMTSRHTTVLQYSTRDSADAFEQLGWETRLLIEREAHHVVGESVVMRAIAEFKPDLIFTIDHLRSELPRVPREIPFVCWIQDNLPNLTSKAAGASVGVRDYVIGAWVHRYAFLHGYPQRQCIATRRMTRPPRKVHGPRKRVEDMVYVSNHSDLPQQRLSAIGRRLSEMPGPLADGQDPAPLVQIVGQRMIEVHDGDACLRDLWELCSLVRDVSATLDGPPLNDDDAERIARFMEDFNAMLYRQQAVRWAAEIAERNGLTFGLYGKGWENHPQFARYARGVIAYGDDLEALTQQARINLQLEPFMPTHHQRLLDGLIAGGFFLCRLRDPLERLYRRTLAFIDRIDPAITTAEEARANLDAAQLSEMDELREAINDVRRDLREVDLIAWLRQPRMVNLFQSMRLAPLPPRYFDVAFIDAAEFEAKVERYIVDEPARQSIAAQQRQFIVDNFTYTANLREVAQRIGTLLADEK